MSQLRFPVAGELRASTDPASKQLLDFKKIPYLEKKREGILFVGLISSSISDLTWECVWLEEAKRLFQRHSLPCRQPSRGFAHSSPESQGTGRSLQAGMQPCQISAPSRRGRSALTLCSLAALIPDPCARRCHCPSTPSCCWGCSQPWESPSRCWEPASPCWRMPRCLSARSCPPSCPLLAASPSTAPCQCWRNPRMLRALSSSILACTEYPRRMRLSQARIVSVKQEIDSFPDLFIHCL